MQKLPRKFPRKERKEIKTIVAFFKNNSAALAVIAVGAALLFSAPAIGAETNSQHRGSYIFDLAGCEGCHWDKKNKGPKLAGGRKFETDFGTFYSPNISPDPETGIGKWTFDDFRRAMRFGVSPGGANYYPAFPYPSYTHILDNDLKDLWAYLQARPAIKQANRDHDLKAPFAWRTLISVWNWLYLDPGPRPGWSRGKYIAEALSHCHECHTPRNLLGGREADMAFGGTQRNPEGVTVPNITPDRETGIGKWSKGDLDMLLTMGMLPDADFVGGIMAELVTHATSKLTPEDRTALMTYIGQLRPISHHINRKSTSSGDDDW